MFEKSSRNIAVNTLAPLARKKDSSEFVERFRRFLEAAYYQGVYDNMTAGKKQEVV